jgi:Fur family ferric uptake transcriptional regulator
MVAPRSRTTAAERTIRAAGERLTAPRAAVLDALLAARQALTHHEIELALAPRLAVDRVTVYRVLDWLVSLGLAHRIAGEDRTWRFLATQGEGHAAHAHFMCSRCGRTVCLDEVAVPPAVKVPRGFEPSHVELNVKGVCAACR